MSYSIVKTDGTQLTAVVDGTIDQVTTDITLIGKNSTAYGLSMNDNFIHMLENFANTTQPNFPIKGQLWYDTQQEKLKVYNGSAFVVTAGTSVSSSEPSGFSAGDLWINSDSGQLYFNDGVSLGGVIAGPIYTRSQGFSGFEVQDVLDINSLTHTVVNLRVGTTLLGVFSKTAFTPSFTNPANSSLDSTTFPEMIEVGFNVSRYPDVAFTVPVSAANALTDGTSTFPPSSFVTTAGNSIIDVGADGVNGALYIKAAKQLVLGPGNDIEISVQPEYSGPQTFQIKSKYANQNFDISLNNTSSGQTSAFFINAQQKFTGIYNNAPQATLDVNGTIRSQLSTPATSSSFGVTGQISWDANYIYICVAPSSWKRVALDDTAWS
jgi:hypothetical protein